MTEDEIQAELDNEDNGQQHEGGEQEKLKELKLIDETENTIRVVFRNVGRDGKDKKTLDKKLQKLNFVYVDLQLNFERIDNLTDEDVQLMKQIDREKEQKRKNAKNNKSMASSVVGSIPEIQAIKVYKQLVSQDPRLHNLSVKQSVQLIKTDKTIRSQIVLKIKKQLGNDVKPSVLTTALGFDCEDIDENPQTDVVNTAYYYQMQQKGLERDAIIDALIVESGTLKTYKEDLIYAIIQKKLKHNLTTLETLNPMEKYIYEHKEIQRIEYEKEEERRKQNKKMYA